MGEDTGEEQGQLQGRARGEGGLADLRSLGKIAVKQ